MSVDSILVWGLVGTLVLTTLLTGARGLRWTRMSLPLMLGTLLASDWDKAQRLGILIHLLVGWLAAVVYALIFEQLHQATWWIGALLGVGHALALLVVGMTSLPHFHPRMSPEIQEPSELPMLEPPGFLALNYGRGTPIATVLAHALYGAILGAFYTV